jgi:hypothetical protein
MISDLQLHIQTIIIDILSTLDEELTKLIQVKALLLSIKVISNDGYFQLTRQPALKIME